MHSFKFTGNGNEYFKIWIVNVLLILCTFGFYYPWAKVRNRRYFYGNTLLNDSPFVYHAVGKQLFAGFLIAFIALVIYNIVTSMAPTYTFLVIAVILVFLPWVIYRSLRFNLKVTSYNNVRFSFAGELGEAYLWFLFLPLGMAIMFGLVMYFAFMMVQAFALNDQTMTAVLGVGGVPYTAVIIGFIFFLAMFVAAFAAYAAFKAGSTHYRGNGSRYGQAAFSGEWTYAPFFKIYMKGMGFYLALYIALIAVGIGVVQMFGADGPVAVVATGVTYIIAIACAVLINSYLTARVREYTYDQLILDEKIRFKSTVEAKPLAKVNLVNLFALIVTLGLFYPWAKVRVAKILVENTHIDGVEDFSGFISQQQDATGALGDQLGDAFDLDIDIAL